MTVANRNTRVFDLIVVPEPYNTREVCTVAVGSWQHLLVVLFCQHVGANTINLP